MKDDEKITNQTEGMELNDNELEQATGGKIGYTICAFCGKKFNATNAFGGPAGYGYCSRDCGIKDDMKRALAEREKLMGM